MVGCLGSEPRQTQSQNGVMRLLSGVQVKPPHLGAVECGPSPESRVSEQLEAL